MKRVYGKLRYLAFAVLTCIGVSSYSTAQAAFVQCTGTADPTTGTNVYFDVSAGTCEIGDNPNPPGYIREPGDMVFAISPAPSGGGTVGRADSDLDGAGHWADHESCQYSYRPLIPAGGNCQDSGTELGDQTFTMKAFVAAGRQETLTVEYTVSANHASIDITNAYVGSRESASNSNGATKNVLIDVTKSQAKLVATNIGTRLTAIANPFSAPTISQPTVNPSGGTTGGGVDGSNNPSQANLVATGSYEEEYAVSNNKVFREIAMRASFDSSAILMAAANQNSDQGTEGALQRANLLMDRPVTVWGHGSYTNVENDRNTADNDSRYDGDVWGYNLGVDYRFSNKLVAGVSAGFSETDLTTTYNSGTYEEKTWTVSPYLSYQPVKNLSLSLVGGYGFGDLDQSRDNGAVNSDTDTDMWFMNAAAAYSIQPKRDLPLNLKATVAFLATHKTIDAYVESDDTAIAEATTNTRQLKPGLEAAYTLQVQNTNVQPFAKVDFIYDLMDKTNDDSSAFDIGGGVRLGNSKTGLSGSIEGSSQVGRDDYSEYNVQGIIAYGFKLGSPEVEKASLIQPFVKSDFSEEGQEFGTGVTYIHSSGLVEADLDVKHILATDTGAPESLATIKAKLKF